MIHGIYVRTRPNHKWFLWSVAASAELASQDVKDATLKYETEGYEKAEVAVQIFESAFHIPEFLNTIKKQEILFN